MLSYSATNVWKFMIAENNVANCSLFKYKYYFLLAHKIYFYISSKIFSNWKNWFIDIHLCCRSILGFFLWKTEFSKNNVFSFLNGMPYILVYFIFLKKICDANFFLIVSQINLNYKYLTFFYINIIFKFNCTIHFYKMFETNFLKWSSFYFPLQIKSLYSVLFQKQMLLSFYIKFLVILVINLNNLIFWLC